MPPPETDVPRARTASPFVSVVVTVRNEARHIRDLLDSLLVQEGPHEIIIVDADSEDNTVAIVKRYEAQHANIRLFERPGTRGESRNFGVTRARGEVVAFIDGDCIANPFWLRELRSTLNGADAAAGRTITIGYWAFEALNRVELHHHGMDVTYPSCNLAYWRDAFQSVGGFDARFHTAEDIDLNFRSVDRGYKLAYNENAVVYARARDTFTRFIKQAYWNGYGRKQLTLKHGSLWGNYSFKRMIQTQASFWGFIRLASASIGYAVAAAREGKHRAQG